jgi:predicted DNA-binding helix-hairpin-helix protein
MEAPTMRHMSRLSSKKQLHEDIVERMRWVKQIATKNEGVVPSGQTTQFVVGAAGETDRDILRTAAALYREVELRRIYFSAFQPIADSPLEEHAATPPLREHRLYQADWLLRIYGFSPREVELALGEKGDLPLAKDPKLTIARKQPWLFPVDLNRASYEELLRVPGIGPVSAGRIVEARREYSISSLDQLRKMGVVTRRAVPYTWFRGILSTEKQMCYLPQLENDLPQAEPSLTGVLS